MTTGGESSSSLLLLRTHREWKMLFTSGSEWWDLGSDWVVLITQALWLEWFSFTRQ